MHHVGALSAYTISAKGMLFLLTLIFKRATNDNLPRALPLHMPCALNKHKKGPCAHGPCKGCCPTCVKPTGRPRKKRIAPATPAPPSSPPSSPPPARRPRPGPGAYADTDSAEEEEPDDAIVPVPVIEVPLHGQALPALEVLAQVLRLPTSLQDKVKDNSPQRQAAVVHAFAAPQVPRPPTQRKPVLTGADCRAARITTSHLKRRQEEQRNRIVTVAAAMVLQVIACFGTKNDVALWGFVKEQVDEQLKVPPPAACRDCLALSSAAVELLDACEPASHEFRVLYSLFAATGANVSNLQQFLKLSSVPRLEPSGTSALLLLLLASLIMIQCFCFRLRAQ